MVVVYFETFDPSEMTATGVCLKSVFFFMFMTFFVFVFVFFVFVLSFFVVFFNR